MAIPSDCLAKSPRRDSGRTVKAANEIRKVTKSDIEGDVANRPSVIRQQAGRTTKTRANKILVRCYPEHSREGS